MDIGQTLSLTSIPHLPVRILQLNGMPKVIAGGVPVTPFNLVLGQRRQEKKATQDSLSAYARAARLYTEFCAHRGRALIDVTNEDFNWFKQALLGDPFPNNDNKLVHLNGKRRERTSDLMLTLLYSLSGDISKRYDVPFQWRTYEGMAGQIRSPFWRMQQAAGVHLMGQKRSHRIKWSAPQVQGLPDDQFVKLLSAARQRWEGTVSDGDLAFAADPTKQRGALFYRNLAILLILRFAGSRRSEAVQVRFEDINRSKQFLYLRTKGHGEERLPALLVPKLNQLIWLYAIRFRPVPADTQTFGVNYIVQT